MSEKIQKILSQWGLASRREAESWIEAGRVTLNGKVARIGDRADPLQDRLAVDGKPLQTKERPELLYFLLNKPKGALCTCDDPQGRQTVLDFLPPELRQGRGLHPVGRLDRNSSGALLLTNDGELTLRLTHPRYHLPKTYDVWLQGHPREQDLIQWSEGMMLDGEKTLPAQLEVIDVTRDQTRLLVTLTEGRNRQIRRLAEQLGLEVTRLHRRGIGDLTLGGGREPLRFGQYRALKPRELRYLRERTGLSPALPAPARRRGGR